MKIKEVLYVSCLNKNLLSMLSIDKKGFRVSFVDGEFVMWLRGKTIDEDSAN